MPDVAKAAVDMCEDGVVRIVCYIVKPKDKRMKKLFALFGALLLWQSVAVAQNVLHIWTGDSTRVVRMAELDSVTVRDAEFYKLAFTPEGLDGMSYTGEVVDAFGSSTFTFNVSLVKGEGNTLYIYNLDPYFAQYGYVASNGYNILRGELVPSEDGQSAALICEAGQAMGYSDAVFISIYDTTSPIIFTITETSITCDTGYGVYEGGFYSAFYPFTLNLAGSTRAPQKAPIIRELAAPKQLSVKKVAPISRIQKGKAEGEAPHQQLKTMTTREITE